MFKFLRSLFNSGYVCQCCGKSVSSRYETLCEECEKELSKKNKL